MVAFLCEGRPREKGPLTGQCSQKNRENFVVFAKDGEKQGKGLTYRKKGRILHLSKRLLKGRQVRSSMAKTGSRVTIKDLASICNVSTATVSREIGRAHV